jgi:hypothetical protein
MMRTVRTVLLTTALALGGMMSLAGSALPQSAAPSSGACGSEALPKAWSNRRKVVHLAVCEWSRFGYPVVEIRPAPPAEAAALPSALGLSAPLRAAAAPPGPDYEAVVPALDVQTHFGRSESDLSASPRIEAYWSAVRPSYVAGIREARRRVERAYAPGWWAPWSAAFTSWVFQTAGVSWFPGSASHVQYLKRTMDERPGQVVPITRYRPLPGDLVCAPRADARGQPTAVSVKAFMASLGDGRDHFESHCDVVVRVNPASVVLVGGNVKNAVTATVAPLRRCRLVRTQARPWAVAVTMGEPYDPCARIESAPLPGWEGQGAERRRQLARTGCRASR